MVQIKLQLPGAIVEAISDRLVDELGALSVATEDADAGTAAERALFGEPGAPAGAANWRRATLTALYADPAAAERALMLLLAADRGAELALQSIDPVPEHDWVRITQSQFAPVPITADFWIVPSWHASPPRARRMIRLDPGLAFGTGTHPTTAMCLRWIAEHARPWPRALDYGCGSGILAIAAALHGAMQVDAVDIDAAAVAATRANALANAVALEAGTPELARGPYTLVLANILAAPLKLLAPALTALLDRGGTLVLAGILEAQVASMREAYAPWLAVDPVAADDGWALMTGCKR
jgi:ribosomal protein L11 methyltransferase